MDGKLNSSEKEPFADLSVPGKRSLAAVVFTDAVGFSLLAGEDEAKALERIREDIQFMRAACLDFDGEVVKHTGDGLLMRFTSAVEALKCVIAILHHMKNRRGDNLFQHRIGAHLGDVVSHENDLLGDGVNIAARLQQICEPGYAYVSGTLMEVVGNRVVFDAQLIGPRQLKNISAQVAVWRVTPFLDHLPVAKPKQNKFVIAGLILVAICLATAFGAWLARPTADKTPTKAAVVKQAQNAPFATDDETAIRQFLSSYSFDEIVRHMREKDPNFNPDAEDLYSSLGEFRRWLQGRLDSTSAKAPLHVEGLWEGIPRSFTAYQEDGLVTIIEDGSKQSIRLANIPAWQLRLIAATAAEKDGELDLHQLLTWMVQFSDVYDLPLQSSDSEPNPTTS